MPEDAPATLGRTDTLERTTGPAEHRLFDRVLALLALAALAAQAVLGPRASSIAHWGAVATSVLVAIGAARTASAPVASLACLIACIAVARRTGAPWQLAMALAIGSFAAFARYVPRLRPPAGWHARGSVPRAWTLLVGGVTPFALIGWFVALRPDLHDVVDGYVPDLPLPVLVMGGVGFAIINATLEELLWRGILQDRLEPLFGVGGAIVLQAASFGLQHAWGFPRGLVGVVLAGGWALMLGLLRRHAGGLLSPILAHVVADATIAVLVLGVLR